MQSRSGMHLECQQSACNGFHPLCRACDGYKKRKQKFYSAVGIILKSRNKFCNNKKHVNYLIKRINYFFFKFWRISICSAFPLPPRRVLSIWSALIRTRLRAGFLNRSRKNRYNKEECVFDYLWLLGLVCEAQRFLWSFSRSWLQGRIDCHPSYQFALKFQIKFF